MIYREMMAVNNLHQEYNRQHQRQLIINYEHSKSATDRKERHIQEKTNTLKKEGLYFHQIVQKNFATLTQRKSFYRKLKRASSVTQDRNR